MSFNIVPTKFFLKQLDDLSKDSLKLIKNKIQLLKTDPFRFKRIKSYKLFLFRIRFEDKRKEKRIIYLINKNDVKLICILDRDKEYADLKKYLTK